MILLNENLKVNFGKEVGCKINVQKPKSHEMCKTKNLCINNTWLRVKMYVGGGHWVNVTAKWSRNWPRGRRAAGGSLPLPWASCFQCCRLERAVCLGDYLDSVCEWILLRPFYKLLNFVGLMGRSCPQAAKEKLPRKFPCFLSLPPPSVEGLVFLPSLLTLRIWRLVSDFTGKFPGLWTQNVPGPDSSHITCKILSNKIKKKRNSTS